MNSVLPLICQELKPILVQLLSEALENALQTVEAARPRYPERVTVEKASEITGYSKNSLYQMHSKGSIPGACKVGGKLLFETAALQAFVAAGGNNKKGKLTTHDCQQVKQEQGLPQWPEKYED